MVLSTSYDERVLLLAPTRRDREVTAQALASVGIRCTVCVDLSSLTRELELGVGSIMLTDLALADADMAGLHQALALQPPWSDVPLVMLCRDREQSPAMLRGLDRLRNVTLIDRPASILAMLSAVQAALRGRRWQYRIRDQIVAQHQAEEALRQADQRKDEFLATLAHELRNPLAPIRTGLQLLHRVPEADAQHGRLLRMMERQLRLLVKLIDELLDVSRIATGKVVLRCEVVDMRGVVEAAVESCQPALDAAGHALQVGLPAHAVWVVGDPSRLAQAVGNLLNNAAKYTPDGGHVGVALDTVEGQARVIVSDDGVGIPPGMLARVFDLFAQVDRTLDRAQGGLGIGLSLVRSLMALHGGTVAARSAGVDRGSEFELRLPAVPAPPGAPAPRSRQEPGAPNPAPPLRVLVVDDNIDAADSLGMLIGMAGHQTRVVYSAPAAWDALPAFEPDVVFCDLGMPGMGGCELAVRLRQDRRYARTRLVALTGWGADEDQRRTRAAGFDFHLTKPASAESLEALLSMR